MSLSLPSRGTSSVVRNRIQPPKGSKNFVVLVTKVIPGKPSKNNPDTTTPPVLVFVTCKDVTIDYVFRQPKPPKVSMGAKSKGGGKMSISDLTMTGQPKPESIINEPLAPELAPSYVVEAGCRTNMISILCRGDLPQPGKLCRLEGVFLDAFQSKDDPLPRLALSCTHVGSVSDMTLDEFFAEIPFVGRSIHAKRDIRGEDTLAYLGGGDDVPQPFHFFVAKVSGATNDVKPGEVVGSFVELAQGVQAELTYAAFNMNTREKGTPELALTGGRIDDTSQRAQFYVLQKTLEGETQLFRCFTRVPSNAGLDALQVDWVQIGDIMPPNIRGYAACTIFRKNTAYIEVDPEPGVIGDLVIGTLLFPSIPEIARCMGYKITWDVAVSIDKRLQTPANMTNEGVPRVDIKECKGINILRYNGDISLLPRAIDEGWVELYLVCNMKINEKRRAELALLSPVELVEELKQTFDRFLSHITPYYVIYAIATDACPCRIHEFVSAIGGTPPGKLLFNEKKPRLEGEEEEE